jgi:uncharacterized membrane protein YgcG
MRLFSVFFVASFGLAGQEIANPVPQGRWVADGAGMIEPAEEARLEARLAGLYQRTGAQLVAVTSDRVPAKVSARAFATRLFNDWGLGSAKDNDGVMIFLVKQERAVEIVTGKGVAARLPNAQLAVLIANQMAPFLQAGKPGAALLTAADEIERMLGGERHGVRPGLLWAAAGLGLIGLVGTGLAMRAWKAPIRLPAAGEFEMENKFHEADMGATAFARAKGKDLFLQVGEKLRPGTTSAFPNWTLWLAAAGLSAGTALAIGGSLEIVPFWVAGLAAALAPGLIFGPSRKDFDGILLLVGGVALVGALIANPLLDGLPWRGYTVPVWVFALGMATCWYLISGRRRWYPEVFRCEKCGGGLTEGMTLLDWQKRAAEAGLVHYRGWGCGKCGTSLLAYMIRRSEDICRKCDKPTKEQTVEGGWQVARCFLCGRETRQKLAKKKPHGAVARGFVASGYEPASTGTESSYDSQRQFDNPSYDPPPSGGSTDGEGASGNW